MPEEKQQQCLVYASITHLHFKSSMFATSEIFLFPSSNSGLPLRKVAGKEVEEEKPKQTLHVDILARSSWQSLPPYPLLTMQNQSSPILFRTLARLCTPPQLLLDASSVSWTAWRGQFLATSRGPPPPHSSPRNTGCSTQPSLHPCG